MAEETERSVERAAASAIGRTLFDDAFVRAHPGATKEELAQGWVTHRREYVRLGRKAVRRMLRAGITLEN
jgi:hypothetical protein